jgi:serine/threonine-protein kinase
LRGDLDTIVLKALAKEPDRRYASAGRLADDLRRYLTGRPVKARPDRWLYRTGKFIRRHRTGVTIAGGAMILLAGAVVVVARQAGVARWERDRAEAALVQSKEVTNYLVSLFEAADPGQTPLDLRWRRPCSVRAWLGLKHFRPPLVKASMLDALGMVFANVDC